MSRPRRSASLVGTGGALVAIARFFNDDWIRVGGKDFEAFGHRIEILGLMTVTGPAVGAVGGIVPRLKHLVGTTPRQGLVSSLPSEM